MSEEEIPVEEIPAEDADENRRFSFERTQSVLQRNSVSPESTTESEEMQESPDEPREDLITITFRRTSFLTFLAPLAFLLGLAFGYVFWGRGAQPTAQTAAADPAAPSSGQQAAQRYDIPIEDNDPVLGAQDAPVTIIEYSDFECPYCRRHFLQVFPQLQEAYGEQVRFVFKDFPLTSIHPNAEPAAVAAHCAHEQGAFWPFHDKLFSMESELGRETYEQYAADLGLDAQEFSDCLDEDRYLAEVQADFQWAARLGVQSTPTFFINGLPVVGAQPFEVFAQVIDGELAGTNN